MFYRKPKYIGYTLYSYGHVIEPNINLQHTPDCWTSKRVVDMVEVTEVTNQGEVPKRLTDVRQWYSVS